MKRIFIAAALLGLFACNREDVVSENDLTPTAISFNNVATRAGLTDLQTNGFGVWAAISNSATTHHLLFDKEMVEYTDGIWDYENTRYWVDETLFAFVAAYPYADFATYPYADDAGNTVAHFVTLAVETDQAADYDPLVATNVTDTNVEGYATTVPLQFQHIMTKVNFTVKKNQSTNENDIFIVDKITISGIKSKATYVALPFQGTVESAWLFDEANTTISFEKEFTESDGLLDLTGSFHFSDTGLLLIPQQITADTVKLTFDFRYKLEGSSDDVPYNSKSIDVFLPASTWESGKSINYLVSLSTSDIIVFEAPTIEPWGGMQNGGTVIIK